MRIRTDRRRNLPFAAHGSSGRSAHWMTGHCPIERDSSYRCVDDGLVHDSEVRTEQLVIASGPPHDRVHLSAGEAASIIDAVISLGQLESVTIEHAGAYASGPAKTDELPAVVIRRSSKGYVVRLRGCLRYRRLVHEIATHIPNISLVRP